MVISNMYRAISISTMYRCSEKHVTNSNARHYGITNGKIKRWYDWMREYQEFADEQIAPLHTSCFSVMKPISPSMGSWRSRRRDSGSSDYQHRVV